MNPKQAWLYAAQWGSYVHAGDPGAIMYEFNETLTVADEEQRTRALAWIERCLAKVAADPGAFAANEAGKLAELASAFRRAPLHDRPRRQDFASRLDEFVAGTVEAAVFTARQDDGEPPPPDVSEADFEAATLAQTKKDAAAFFTANIGLIVAENLTKKVSCGVDAYAGHDFWLTRTGQGCGFWDGDWREPAATLLTAAAKAYGTMDLCYEDGRLVA